MQKEEKRFAIAYFGQGRPAAVDATTIYFEAGVLCLLHALI